MVVRVTESVVCLCLCFIAGENCMIESCVYVCSVQSLHDWELHVCLQCSVTAWLRAVCMSTVFSHCMIESCVYVYSVQSVLLASVVSHLAHSYDVHSCPVLALMWFARPSSQLSHLPE